MDQTAARSITEFAAALLQAAVTLALSLYAAFLYRRYRKPYFLWFSAAWMLYFFRVGAISTFLFSEHEIWLYWHQVLTWWTALGLLFAALVFARQVAFRWIYLPILLFPVAWSFFAIYVLEDFLSAALPTVVFLSVVTALTGAIFFRYWRKVRAPGALMLAVSFALWSLHHLDYPFLRAQGAWSPWGYYLDIMFLLATAAGMTMLVVDELQDGLRTLATLAGGARGATEGTLLDEVLSGALTLPAARGAAFFAVVDGRMRLVRGAGDCEHWTSDHVSVALETQMRSAVTVRRPVVVRDVERAPNDSASAYAYAAVLPVVSGQSAIGVLVMVGDARDPFAALDEEFLLALGRQIGTALEEARLSERLRERTGELERLSAAVIRQHEEERRRLSRELHDETAQVFSAVKLQLGVLREQASPEVADGLGRALGLVDTGMRSIRNVTETLRPAVLEELGLSAALRSLAADVAERCHLEITMSVASDLPRLTPDAELAIYRALQESLSNVVRHAAARAVTVSVDRLDGGLRMVVRDDGAGIPPDALRVAELRGHVGLSGMRERLKALGGTARVERAAERGTEVLVWVPVPRGDSVK